MTKAQIQAAIIAARTSPEDLVTWAELKEILEGLNNLAIDDLGTLTNGKVLKVASGAWAQGNDLGLVVSGTPSTDQVVKWNGSAAVWAASPGGGGGLVVGGTPVTGYVPKWTGTDTIWAPDNTASGGTGWDSNGTLTADRSVAFGSHSISFTRAAAVVDEPNIYFRNTHDNHNGYIMVSVSPSGDANGRDFEFRHDSTLQPGGIYGNNEVFRWGFNISRERDPSKSGLWYAIEPHWLAEEGNPDLIYLEYHLSQDITGDPGEMRLFSHTFINRGDYENSSGSWDFRCTRFSVIDFQNQEMVSLAKDVASGLTMTFIGPTTAAFIMQVGGSIGNNMLWYPYVAGAEMNLLNDKWARWRYHNTKINVVLTTATNSTNAVSLGLSPGDLYRKSDGSVWVVDI